MKHSFFLIITYFSSGAAYCSDSPETITFISKQEYSTNNDNLTSKQKTTGNCLSCTNVYKNYSCSDRGCNALIGSLPNCCLLGIREMVTDCVVWTKNESASFAQAHAKMWCAKEAWFPCCCNTSKEVCTSTMVNCSTGITIASITYALCLFLPCITQKGCTFIKKKNM